MRVSGLLKFSLLVLAVGLGYRKKLNNIYYLFTKTNRE